MHTTRPHGSRQDGPAALPGRPFRLAAWALVVLLWPAPGLAALSDGQARQLLTAWIAAETPGLAPGCLKTVASRSQNGGYTVTLDTAACGQNVPVARRWRIDAATTEVFEENDRGKFVVPPAVAGRPGQPNLALAAGRPGLLPPQARVVEYAPLPAPPDRAYILWMLAPKRQPHERGEPYTCPEYSRGSSWTGPTRLSLLDTAAGTLRNTIEVRDPLEEADRFDLPYRIPGVPPFAYAVPEGTGRDREGRPELLRLRDLDGDGQAREFFLASSGNCMLTLFAVFGYDPATDAVAAYPVTLTTRTGEKTETGDTAWLNFWPLAAGGRQGRSTWEVDTRGRAGCLERFTVAFDPAARRFVGTVTVTDCQD